MTEQVKHTPVPWIVAQHESQTIDVISKNHGHIARIDLDEHYKECGEKPDRSDEESFANAAFIVNAANCYDELVQALENLYDILRDDQLTQPEANRARSALAKAGAA